MAKYKVSDLTQVTSANVNDLMYIVHSSGSYSITVGNFLGAMNNPTLQGTVTLGGAPDTMYSAGVVNLTTPISYLNIPGTIGNISIPNGTNGQIKVLVTTASSGGKYILSNIAGSANVNFTRVGDTATLAYTNNNWFVIGGTANVSH
jgi:hypothetical protein